MMDYAVRARRRLIDCRGAPASIRNDRYSRFMTVTSTSSPLFPPLLDPKFYVDLDAMHAAFGELRATNPLGFDEATGLWVITRHADVIEVERRHDTFVSGHGYRSFEAPGETNMIALDDPAHAEHRGLVSRRFTPKAVRNWEPFLVDRIDTLIDEFIGHGELEVVSELAAQLPARLTTQLLGFPEDRWRDVKTWSESLMRYDSAATDPDAQAGVMNAIIESQALLGETLAARRSEPADDLITVWSQAELGGCPMTHEAIVNEAALIIPGGVETTRTTISRGLAVFCDQPDQWEAMVDDASLVLGAVEELIRWVTPINNFFRTAATDTTLAGNDIAAGDRLILLYPSANRDESVFADPTKFDIRRSPNPHVGFGFGAHVCLGAPLARFELGLLFERLSKRITKLRIIEGPELDENIFVTTVRSLRLGFDVR